MKQKKIKLSPGERVFNFLIYVVLSLVALICILPFILIVSGSFSDSAEIMKNGYSLLPRGFSLDGYRSIFLFPKQIARAYGISIFVTVCGTLLGLVVMTLCGYALSRSELRYRNVIAFIVYFTTLFSGGLVPWYIVITQLGMKNTVWALIFPLAVSSFNVIICRTFFKTTVPESLIESAKMDGASQLTIFSRIVLPISLPVLATIGLFLCFAYWNDWYQSLLYIDDHKLLSLQALLNQILTNIQMLAKNAATMGASAAEMLANMPQEAARMAIVVIIVLPIACAYPFFQKYFISGLTVGAVKG